MCDQPLPVRLWKRGGLLDSPVVTVASVADEGAKPILFPEAERPSPGCLLTTYAATAEAFTMLSCPACFGYLYTSIYMRSSYIKGSRHALEPHRPGGLSCPVPAFLAASLMTRGELADVVLGGVGVSGPRDGP